MDEPGKIIRLEKVGSPTDATQWRPYLMYPSQSSGLRFPFEFIVSATRHPGLPPATRSLHPLLHLCTGRRPICTFALRAARGAALFLL